MLSKKNGKRKSRKLGIIVGLVLATIMSHQGGDIFATNVAPGVSNIGDPTYHNEAGGYSTYNYVYFGKTANNSTLYDQPDTPILYRVLNTKANNRSADPDDDVDALLMLTEYDIFKIDKPWDDTLTTLHTWSSGCQINTLLNNDSSAGGTLYDCFTTTEKTAIIETVNGEIQYTDKITWKDTVGSTYAYGCGLTNDKLFLLSANEAVNQNYGFARIEDGGNTIFADGNRIAKRGNASGQSINWWLRSEHTYDADEIAAIDTTGRAEHYSSNAEDVGVRFALNVNLANVLYTSSASEGSTPASYGFAQIPASAPSCAAICATGTVPGTEFASKLTILDTTRSEFQVTESEATSLPSGVITLNYTGAQTNTNQVTNEYISAIIKDSDGEGEYYGVIKPSEQDPSKNAGEGEVEIELPNLAAGNYTLMILNEQRNPAKETNYAGYDTVALQVQNVQRRAILTATDEGTGLWKIVATQDPDARALYTFTGNETTQTVIFNVPDLTLNTVYVVDKAGNVSDPLQLVPDETAPQAGEITYNSGNISVKVTEAGSGIAQIDSTEYPTYPTETSTPVQKNNPSIHVQDALGNEATLEIPVETDPPTVTAGYKHTDDLGVTTAIITATPAGDAGLWKVLESDANPLTDTGLETTFVGEGDTKKAVFQTSNSSVGTVYVVDHAGNVGSTSLYIDDTAPGGTVQYANGQVTVTVTDDESGIAQIGSTTYTDYLSSKQYVTTNASSTLNVIDAVGNQGTVDIDTTAPVGVSGYRKIDDTQNPDVLKGIVTVTKTGDAGLWKVIAEDSTISNNPTLEDIIAATPLTSTFIGEGTTKKAAFSSSDTTIVNVYVVDHAGNMSTQIPLTLDTEAPTAVMDYSGENISVTVTDEGAGIAQIGSDYYANSGYPSTDTVEVAKTESSINVVDAVGNSATISFDQTGPVISEGFSRTSGGTTYVTLTVTDEGSGLLNIVASDGNNNPTETVLYTFTGNETTQTVRFSYNGSVEKVFAYDKAGNVSDEFELTLDNTAPTVIKGFIREYTPTV